MVSPRPSKYTAVGSKGAPVRNASVAGPAGIVVCLTEEVDRDPVAGDVAIGEQAHDVTILDGAQHLASGARAERDDVHPETVAGTTAKKSNSSGGSSASTTTVTGKPSTLVSQKPAHSQPPR